MPKHDAPYQITKTPIVTPAGFHAYRYALVHKPTQRQVTAVVSVDVLPPRDMRRAQAMLNSAAVLNSLGV